MTNHPTQAGPTAALPADLVGDDAGLVAELSARVVQLEAIAAKLAGALEFSRGRAFTAVRDMKANGLGASIPQAIFDKARQALTEYKDATDGK